MKRLTRRDFLKGSAVSAGIVGANMLPFMLQRAAAQDRPIRAAMSNAGLQASWCAQGADSAMHFGELLGVDIVWFDGELDPTAQRAKFDQIAATPDEWDFVAVQAVSITFL
jgi:ribose transport system substrate-binding protein